MRKLGLSLTFWLAGILLSTNGFALGLGEIEVNSFLNQPLDAKIEVISARSGEIDDLLVTLASRDAFTKAGLSRPRSLSELRFAVQIDEEMGTAVVLVTTKSAVKEPFLNFLVEADWAKGRVLREFTILLDPPFYADTPVPDTSSDQTTAPPESTAEAPPAGVIADSEPIAGSSTTTPETPDSESTESVVASDTATTEVIATSTTSPAQTQQSTTGSIAVSEDSENSSTSEEAELIADESDSMMVGDVHVIKGDTLWSIATQFKDSEHSMSQVMLAIQRMNPESFAENNINILKVGTVLRAPTSEQLGRISEREALAEVLEQNGLWEGYVERVSETTPVSMAGDGGEIDSGDGDAAVEEQSNLSLLAPGEGESDAAGTTQGDGEDSDELSRKLSFAEEELDAARIENADLESRIAELEATLSKVQELQKMMEIEDDSLAQLQANQNEETATTAAEEMEQTSLETITTEQPASTTEALAEEMNAADEEALLEELLTEDSAAEAGAVEEQAEPIEVVQTEPIEVVEEQTSVTLPAPVIPPEPVQSSESFLDGMPSFDDLFQDPLLLGGLSGIILLLLGLVGYKKWKSKQGFVDLGESDAGDDKGSGEDSTIIDDDDHPFLEPEVKEAEQTNIVPPAAGELAETEEPAAAETEEPAAEELDFSATEIIPPESPDEALVELPEAPAAEQEAEEEQQDDTLNEVDVYLAYGLYDNAEDLLKQSLETSPGRADYRAKLLDTYFATKSVDAFVKQAEALKGMGDAASRHWDRVQVMGYELAPDNDMFSGAKDSSLTTSDLGIAKPEAADFDLGSGEGEAGETDFLLSEEVDDFIDSENFVETVAREDQVVETADESPQAEAATDDLSDLEFAIDADDEEIIESVDGEADAMDFELADDMGGEDTELASGLGMDIDDSTSDSEEEVEMDFDIDEALNFDDEELLEAGVEANDDDIQATVIIRPEAYPELEDISEFEEAAELEDPSETNFEADVLEDTPAASLEFESDEVIGDIQPRIEDITDIGGISLGLDDSSDNGDEILDIEDQTDISQIDLGVDDISSDDIDADAGDIELDLDAEPVKTDTFAPGDFDDPDEIVPAETDITGVNIDDIDDLVLPDDVDEVSTKLDLARAFIDMGDAEGARSSLDDVLNEGSDEQKAEAEELMKQV